ncbi:sugar ABC transporter substrate-binding protein [Rhizobium sp. NTR19]|uniref:Sugar ABC transporter substrate-binding protein n=1 Tax=Neorhizobium turbinariae TaxID=2937795 RepID=A0ABT0IWP4_9HYPH|nr:sugar ABC transporter substrate-binding protein [Neorhizobium turbinariae]MCK8782299.1 sugar ABC transporter substrate-binding protein [Neorhizobium turbinariae]
MKTLRNSLTAMAVAALCSTAVAMPASAETLKFVSWQKDEKGYGDWWAEVIKTFEAKHPGTTIEWTKVERSAYADTMTTLFAGGQPPQIVHLASFEFQSFAENGWLEPLDPWIKKAGLDMKGWAGQDKCMWNEETACIMMLYYGFVMGYNQEILDKAGAKVPTNWNEYLDVLRKTTKDLNGDGIIDQFGTGHETRGSGGQYLTEMLNYILDAGGSWTDVDGKVTINTPQMIEGLKRWKTVIGESLSPRDMTSGDVRKLFADGKMALKLEGPWIYPIMQQGAAFKNLKLTKPPFNPPNGGTSNILAMASEISDEQKELVWDFIATAMSPELQTKFATVANSTPPRPNTDIGDVAKTVPHFQLLLDTQKAAAEAKIDRIPKGLELNFNQFAKMVMEESQRMIIDDLDPAAVAKTMQEKAEVIQNQ